MRKCQVDGCTNDDVQHYEIIGYDPEPQFEYCDQHAYEAGFCTNCGAFFGGTEEFFMSKCPRICSECCEDINEDLDLGHPDDFDDEDEMEDM